MARTLNYNKKCPKCDGKFIVGTTKGETYLWIFKAPGKIIMCSNCNMGIIKPRKVIQHLDRFEPTIIY